MTITGKTLDGIRLSAIVRMASAIPGIAVREGTKHPYMLLYAGLRPCPVAESTHARRMLVPWLRQATGYSTNDLYASLQSGELCVAS